MDITDISQLIISKNLSKKDLKIDYLDLYNEVLLRQKDGSLVEALKPNNNFFEKYDINSIKYTGIEHKPMVIRFHVKDESLKNLT